MLMDPIDRPFRSREEVEMEEALEAQYHALAIAELLEAIAAERQLDRAAA